MSSPDGKDDEDKFMKLCEVLESKLHVLYNSDTKGKLDRAMFYLNHENAEDSFWNSLGDWATLDNMDSMIKELDNKVKQYERRKLNEEIANVIEGEK